MRRAVLAVGAFQVSLARARLVTIPAASVLQVADLRAIAVRCDDLDGGETAKLVANMGELQAVIACFRCGGEELLVLMLAMPPLALVSRQEMLHGVRVSIESLRASQVVEDPAPLLRVHPRAVLLAPAHHSAGAVCHLHVGVPRMCRIVAPLLPKVHVCVSSFFCLAEGAKLLSRQRELWRMPYICGPGRVDHRHVPIDLQR
mmetsp:Transcript_37436/g.89857  ORF Transcript_37436/g.89857 Transcript_37436/m.89857 type:complete len:202 (+) Transcript_37436:304-909(+)